MRIYFILAFLTFIISNFVYAQTSTCTYLGSANDEYYNFECNGVKTLVKKSADVTSVMFNIVRDKAGVESDIVEPLEAGKGAISSFLSDPVYNWHIIDKYKIGIRDRVEVSYKDFVFADKDIAIYEVKDDTLTIVGTMEGEKEKKAKELEAKETKKKKILEAMKTLDCYHRDGTEVFVINYKDSCGDKKLCYSTIDCVDQTTSKHFRSPGVCAMVDGKCPSANKCARDLDIDNSYAKIMSLESTEKTEETDAVSK
jgi:hypothetical protein